MSGVRYEIEQDIDDWKGQVGEFTDAKGVVRECVVKCEFANGHGLVVDYWRDDQRIENAQIPKGEFRL